MFSPSNNKYWYVKKGSSIGGSQIVRTTTTNSDTVAEHGSAQDLQILLWCHSWCKKAFWRQGLTLGLEFLILFLITRCCSVLHTGPLMSCWHIAMIKKKNVQRPLLNLDVCELSHTSFRNKINIYYIFIVRCVTSTVWCLYSNSALPVCYDASK